MRVASSLNLRCMGVRSAELSASLKVFLSVCLKPLVALPLLQLKPLSTRHAADLGTHHDTRCSFVGGPSAERKQKQSIPGLVDFELDGDALLDIFMGPCQYPETLAPYRNVEGRYTTFLTGYSSNAHVTGSDLSCPTTAKPGTTAYTSTKTKSTACGNGEISSCN